MQDQAEDLLRTGSFDSLSSAQFAVAERYGFPSWQKLEAYVGSVGGGMGELERAILDDDVVSLTALLREDPGLIHREGHWVRRRRHNGYLPLAYAAFFGKVRVMETLLATGADVHAGGDKALRAAAYFDQNLPAVELLMSHGADPNATTISPSGHPYRVIDYPCMTMAPAILRFLLSHGGQLQSDNVGMILATDERRPGNKAGCLAAIQEAGFELPDTPPMALHLRDVERLEEQLRRDPRLLSKVFREEEIFPSEFGLNHPSPYAFATPLTGGVTLLHMAVEFCDLEVTEWLLMRGADVNVRTAIDEHGYGGWTPLFHAVATLHVPRGFPEFAGLLLRHGADPQVRASIRKPTTEGDFVSWEDVTAAEYARKFVYPALVNHEALRLVQGG